MNDYSRQEKRRGRIIFAVSIILTVGAVALSIWLAGPPPPRQITIATGVPGGAYDSFGQLYKQQLEKMGLEVELVNSKGALENLRLVAEGKADVAFTQGGLAPKVDNKKGQITGLAALYLEPVWVFTRSTDGITRLAGLKARTVTIGLVDSGTEAVARALLGAHGVTPENTRFVHASPADAEAALIKGDADAAIIVSSPEGATVQRLLRKEGVALMDFARQDMAHTRLFPFLRPVKLYAGLIDLENNVPATEKTLLAPAALLVAQGGLHAQVVEELHEVMNSLHSGGNLLSPPNTFPTLDGVDLPIHEAAEAYARSGGSWMSRMVPYWAVRWFWRLQVVALPLLAVWLPTMKFLPQFYSFWGRRLVKRCYRKLRDLETRIDRAETPEDLRLAVTAMEALRQHMWAKTQRMPAILQPDIYQWRTHVSEVCARADEKRRRLTNDFM